MTPKRKKSIHIGLGMAAATYAVGALLMISGASVWVAWALFAGFVATAGVTVLWALALSVLPALSALPRTRQDPWALHWHAAIERPVR